VPTLQSLLADPSATIEVVAKISYYSAVSTVLTEWVSLHGWYDTASGPVAAYIPPLLNTPLSISHHILPLDPGDSFGAYAQIDLINDLDDSPYTGRYDAWQRVSIDDQPILIYLVGYLSDGTRVNLSDVIGTPYMVLRGVGVPAVGDSTVTLTVRDDAHSLDSPLQPVTYSPPCLVFPGTVGGAVNVGDNLDLMGSFALSFYVWTDDPGRALQFPLNKDGSTTGYYIRCGQTATVEAGVELVILAQTPTTTVTAAGVIRARQWHRIDISVDTAAGTRRIDIDGVTAVTSAGVTGTPNANAISLTMGNGLLGRMSRVLYWGAARSNATMSAEGRIPITGSEANLTAYFPFDEGRDTTVSDRKSGSVLTGTVGTGTTWGNFGGHYPAISGQYRPFVLGTVPRAPVTWIDPPKQIGEVSYGGVALVSEIQSNHTAIATANYTVNLTAGTFQITAGALSGTYSTTVTANNFWNSALLFGTGSAAVASIPSPTGSRTIGIQVRADFTANVLRYMIGWQNSALAGAYVLRVFTGAVNRVNVLAINNTPTSFNLNYDNGLIEGNTYTIIATMNTTGVTDAQGVPANTIRLYVNGEVVGDQAISGTWTASLTQFGVGCRPDTSTNPWVGRLDEGFVFTRTISLTEARAIHLLPLTGAESGLVRLWHFDDAASVGSAAATVGGTALTLTSVTRTAGRSAAADLARKCYYIAGYVAADLDEATWRACLNKNSADCGWWSGDGVNILDVAGVILGGLGFVRYKIGTVIYVERFGGVSGVADVAYSVRTDVRQGTIEGEPGDPAVNEWQIEYATNNVRLDAANVAGGLATTDPDRYAYASAEFKVASQGDGTVLRRFPRALPRTRRTALLYQRDAEVEATRLLPIHKHGSDNKSVPLWVLAGSAPILHEASFDIAELEMDQTNFIVIGLEIEDDEAMAVVWRPAKQVG
jgi:hypothetical protein